MPCAFFPLTAVLSLTALEEYAAYAKCDDDERADDDDDYGCDGEVDATAVLGGFFEGGGAIYDGEGGVGEDGVV